MDDITKLKKLTEQQDKQILSLRKAVQELMGRLKDIDQRTRRNTEQGRRTTNDINTIKRKLGNRD